MKRHDHLIDALMTYMAMNVMAIEILKPRRRDSEILVAKLDRRLDELYAEEVRLVAVRAYVIELWG